MTDHLTYPPDPDQDVPEPYSIFDSLSNQDDMFSYSQFSTDSYNVDNLIKVITLDIPDEFRKLLMPVENVDDKVIESMNQTLDITHLRYLGGNRCLDLVRRLDLEEYLAALTVSPLWKTGLLEAQHYPTDNSKCHELLRVNLAQTYLDPSRIFTFVTMMYNNVNLNSRLPDTARSTFMLAAIRGDLQIMRILKSKGAHLYYSDENGHNALHLAIRHKQSLVATWLIQNGYALDKQNIYGQTALHVCVSEWIKPSGSLQQASIAHMLIENGADYGIFDRQGDTPIHLAARHNDSFPLYMLMDDSGATGRKANLYGESLLHIAARAGHPVVLRMLLSKDCSLINLQDNFDATALHRSCWIGHLTNVLTLLDYENIDVNLQTLSGRSPLHHAAMDGNVQIIQALLNKNADVNLKDSDGLTPVQALLKTCRHRDSLLTLVRHGNLSEEDMKAANAYFKLRSTREYAMTPKVQTIFKSGSNALQTKEKLQILEAKNPRKRTVSMSSSSSDSLPGLLTDSDDGLDMVFL